MCCHRLGRSSQSLADPTGGPSRLARRERWGRLIRSRAAGKSRFNGGKVWLGPRQNAQMPGVEFHHPRRVRVERIERPPLRGLDGPVARRADDQGRWRVACTLAGAASIGSSGSLPPTAHESACAFAYPPRHIAQIVAPKGTALGSRSGASRRAARPLRPRGGIQQASSQRGEEQVLEGRRSRCARRWPAGVEQRHSRHPFWVAQASACAR